MADKPNPFLKLLNRSVQQQAAAKPATPKPEEKNTSDSTAEGLTSQSVQGIPVSSPAQEKTSTAQAIPSAQLLLGAAIASTAKELDSPAATALQPYDREELAMIDTENMEPTPVNQRVPNLNVRAANLAKASVLQSGESVRELCDRLDNMIGDKAAPDLQGPNLFEIRNYVQTLMITLKSRPEFDSVVIDKDVRNVMKFIRATRQEALELREVKTVKKATRAVKKEVTSSKTKGFEKAFQSIMFGAPKLGDK